MEKMVVLLNLKKIMVRYESLVLTAVTIMEQIEKMVVLLELRKIMVRYQALLL